MKLQNIRTRCKHFQELQFRSRNTRALNLPSARLDIEKQSTIFNCCKLINSVGEDLLDQQSKQSLKKLFQKRCLDMYREQA